MIDLVNMPFASIMRPSLSLALIKAQLLEAGMEVQTHNVNFIFARALGFGPYEMIARFKGVETQIGEWLFAEDAWRRPFGPDEEEFLRLCGDEIETIPSIADPLSWLSKVKRSVAQYLELCYDLLTKNGTPRVVAFSCQFFQTVAALAFGRLLKERHPEITLAYGGVCFHGEAGEELFEKVPWIDVVSTGEADPVIVPLFRALEHGDTPVGLPGVRARDATGAVVVGPPAELTSAAVLDALPDPDYDEFFEDAGQVGLSGNAVWLDRVSLPFETSRGCWWGQKKHCAFCGLNGEGMAYRPKSAERAFATLERLVARYPWIRNLQAADNILAMGLFKSLIPRLAAPPLLSANGQQVKLFFEVKANLKRAQIKALADAGVCYVQPGIENLSTHILEVIEKGVTALQNVFFLKCATEYGMLPAWTILIQVPGERREDYQHMEAWLPLLFHLRPPTGGAPRVECHRHSPYFLNHDKYIEDIQPARWYRGIFPEDDIDLRKIAYYFDVTWKHTLGGSSYDGLLTLAHMWMGRWRQTNVPQLTMHDTDEGGLEIEDTRGKPACWQLSPEQAQIYRQIDDIATAGQVRAQLGDQLSETDIRATLASFVEQGLALEENHRFLGLALPPVAIPSRATRQLQMRQVVNQPKSARASDSESD